MKKRGGIGGLGSVPGGAEYESHRDFRQEGQLRWITERYRRGRRGERWGKLNPSL